MENLEEVLQALDEFQKMRPTEIPRELEDYLCWVAKTGDPVYQWSLIKTLFREKLTRVMTDFYESCPSLELAPCPNVEHFNYDTMKSNLLERLESFANAPFTVQRICELLTAPRKEYNRVDKFMRAIEKNILVVSTREPGPIGRRSENGDSMVNGSVDEDSSVTQPPQDVEMEYWEKDCTSTVTISVHTVENEPPILHTVIPPVPIVKNVFGQEDSSGQEKLPKTSARSESQDTQITTGLQNTNTIVSETSGILGDVPEAIMNEDTSSQPSLDLESEECEDNSKLNEKVGVGSAVTRINEEIPNSEKSTELLVKSALETKANTENAESVSSGVDSLLKITDAKLRNSIKSDLLESPLIVNEGSTIDASDNLHFQSTNLKNAHLLNNTEDVNPSCTKSYELGKDIVSSSRDHSDSSTFSNGENVPNISHSELGLKEKLIETITPPIKHLKENLDDAEVNEELKPVIEEPSSTDKSTAENSMNTNSENNSLTIIEVVEDESRVVRCLVPDPIPIVEEPKDGEHSTRKLKNRASVVEVHECPPNEESSIKIQPAVEAILKPEKHETVELKENDIEIATKLEDTQSSTTENVMQKEECGPVELMEVDDESLSMFQQDEPMEQETTEFSKS